jgi:hypothetical protein
MNGSVARRACTQRLIIVRAIGLFGIFSLLSLTWLRVAPGRGYWSVLRSTIRGRSCGRASLSLEWGYRKLLIPSME